MQKLSSGSFKNIINKMCLQIYMYKRDLALNKLQWFICQKTQPHPTKPDGGILRPLK